MSLMNYLEEIPEDIIDIISKYVAEDDYDIIVNTYRSWGSF